MKYYADFHIHSCYSRATSKKLNLENLALWAKIKGISVVGTGDFVHPGWFKEIKGKLEPAEEGLFRLKPEYESLAEKEAPHSCTKPVRFMLSAEISNIYKRMDRVRKVHNVIFAPDLKIAEKIQKKLDSIGNIKSDGRPILGLDSRDLLEIVLESDDKSFLVPAHIWTPWFSVLGSKSGFDRITDCYGDLCDHIFAVETGLSSDPPMNWRLSQLDKYVLVSNSDAHSSAKLGREANIFDTRLSYSAMLDAMRDESNKGMLGTVEFFPQEGKYHLDGHRKCSLCLTPQQTRGYKGRCPKCGGKLTVGVYARVDELADRPEGARSVRYRPFHSLIPLTEVISEISGVGPNSKKVQGLYFQVIERLGSEYYILMDAPLEDIRNAGGRMLAEAVKRMRDRNVIVKSGYDGEFGRIMLFSDEEKKGNKKSGQSFYKRKK